MAASSRTKSTFSSARTGTAGLEGLGRVLQGPYEPHPLPVVAAAHRLEDHGEPVTGGIAASGALRREGRHVGGVLHQAVARTGSTDLRESRAHHTLVLGVHQSVGSGAHGDAVRLQGPQVLRGHVLVIEGDHVTAPREVTQRVQVAIVAYDDFADHLRRGILRSVTEELELDAERDARLVCHTSELPPADHADYRERHTPRVSADPRCQDYRRPQAPDQPPG